MFLRECIYALGIFHANRTNRKLVEAPSNFIAGRLKAALLFCFFGDFRLEPSIMLNKRYIKLIKRDFLF